MVLLPWLGACRLLAPVSPPGEDSAPLDSRVEELPWPALALWPRWESVEADVSTGAAFADLDGDGDGDLVVANGNDVRPGPVRIYWNTGGTLASTARWSSAQERYYAHLAVGDVDGDGREDVVVARYLGDGGWGEPGGVDLFLNGPEGLSTTPTWAAEGFNSFAVALADVDLDGDLDLAATAGEAYQGVQDRARLWLNPGDGRFEDTPSWQEAEPGASYDLGFFDADGDGWLDLALAHAGAPHTITFNEGGQLAAAPGWEAPEAEGFEGNTLDWGDVNADGWLDLVVADNLQRGGPGQLRAWCGPDFGLCWRSQDEPTHRSAVSLEDLDGDGDLDLVAGAWWGELRLYTQEDGQLSATPAASSGTRTVIEALAWEDLDGSHRRVVRLEGQGLAQVPGRARVLSVQGGVAAGGWISGPGAWTAELLAPAPRDLCVSNWDSDVGNQLYVRASD